MDQCALRCLILGYHHSCGGSRPASFSDKRSDQRNEDPHRQYLHISDRSPENRISVTNPHIINAGYLFLELGRGKAAIAGMLDRDIRIFFHKIGKEKVDVYHPGHHIKSRTYERDPEPDQEALSKAHNPLVIFIPKIPDSYINKGEGNDHDAKANHHSIMSCPVPGKIDGANKRGEDNACD